MAGLASKAGHVSDPAPIPASTRSWFAALLSSDDVGADSIIVVTVLCAATFCAISGYVFCLHPEQWNPANFGVGTAMIVGAFGTAKGWRDRLSRGPE